MALTPFLKSRPVLIAQLSSNLTASYAAAIMSGVGCCNPIIAVRARSLKRSGSSSNSFRSILASFLASRSPKSFEDAARDEYYLYIPELYKLISHKLSQDKISKHLLSIERKQMNLPGREENTFQVAGLLKGLEKKHE